MRILVAVVSCFLLAPALTVAAQCGYTQQQPCSCPNGGGLTYNQCIATGGASALSSLPAICCSGHLVNSCFEEGPCPFTAALKTPGVQDRLLQLASNHMVFFADCRGSFHPVLQSSTMLAGPVKPLFQWRDDIFATPIKIRFESSKQ
jgi:hypothetical protein